MARREQQIPDDASPLADFARSLREERRRAGSPTYREMAKTANYSHSALSRAASGTKLPTWDATEAFVRACGGDVDAWRTRYQVTKTRMTTAAVALTNEQCDVVAQQDWSSVFMQVKDSRDGQACPASDWISHRQQQALTTMSNADRWRFGTMPLAAIGDTTVSQPDGAVLIAMLLRQIRDRSGLTIQQISEQTSTRDQPAVLAKSTISDMLNRPFRQRGSRLPSDWAVQMFLTATNTPRDLRLQVMHALKVLREQERAIPGQLAGQIIGILTTALEQPISTGDIEDLDVRAVVEELEGIADRHQRPSLVTRIQLHLRQLIEYAINPMSLSTYQAECGFKQGKLVALSRQLIAALDPGRDLHRM